MRLQGRVAAIRGRAQDRSRDTTASINGFRGVKSLVGDNVAKACRRA